MSAPKLCAAAQVRGQIVAILESWGMDPELVRTTAEVMVETDLAIARREDLVVRHGYEPDRDDV